MENGLLRRVMMERPKSGTQVMERPSRSSRLMVLTRIAPPGHLTDDTLPSAMTMAGSTFGIQKPSKKTHFSSIVNIGALPGTSPGHLIKHGLLRAVVMGQYIYGRYFQETVE